MLNLFDSATKVTNAGDKQYDNPVVLGMPHGGIEMEQRLQLYRQNRPFPNVKNNTVIVVDDGLATGLTAFCEP